MSDSVSQNPDSKLTRTKRQWAEEGKFLTGDTSAVRDAASRPRLPPGQHRVTGWPVLDLGVQPVVAQEEWRLEIERPQGSVFILDWDGLMALPQSDLVSDIHCVTTWSRYDNRWQGVRIRDLLDAAGLSQIVGGFVMLSSYDGYSTNLPFADFSAPDSLLAHHWEGQPLTREHGGPVRLVVPHLYFWKSAKWLRCITWMASDAPGYWEENGYHMRGDPWSEERYGVR